VEISKLNDKQFAVLFSKVVDRIKEDPIENFVKASGFLDLTPTAVQEVVLKVIFGKELDPIVKKKVRIEGKEKNGDFKLLEVLMTEYEIYEFLTETKYQLNTSDAKKIQINKIDLICGRRSGKTLLAAIISIYCAMCNNWKSFLKKTPFATVLIMSHSKEFSEEVLEQIRTLIESSEILSRLKNKDKKNSASTMNLVTPWVLQNGNIEYSRVQIKVAAASSKTTRGVAACAILCDEIAFWNLDENMKETDAKIMKAVRPSMKQFGALAMLIKLSSPGIKQGILYNEYKQKREGTLPESYAVFKAPSWAMTPSDVLPESELKEEWKLDPDGFDTEYRGNFSDSLSNFIDPAHIDIAILKGVKFQTPETEGAVRYKAAIDAAYKTDHFTFSVTGYMDGRLKQYVSKGWKGSKSNPISAFEVAEYIRNICKEFSIDEVAADQYSFQPLKEIFEKFNIVLKEYTFTPVFKRKIYANLKKLFHSTQADILDNEIQTKELKELVVEQSGTGMIRIGHPNGGSDDYADSLAISAFLATEEVSMGQFNFDSSFGRKDYGIRRDITGRALAAPSPDMLVDSGHLSVNIEDNASDFIKDPITGKLKRIDEDDEVSEKDEGFHFDF
jgi:hypothetical protein